MGALLDGGPLAVALCDPRPVDLPAGSQELVVSPGAAFVVDGIRLTGPLGDELPSAPTTPAAVGGWGADHRELQLPPSAVARVLVVPESINPGWSARTPNGITLTPVPVNGWQQGWLVPAGTSGTVILNFASNAWYRAGLTGGLALLPVLLILALLPARRGTSGTPVQPWTPGWPAAVAAVTAGGLISGPIGAAVFVAAIAAHRALRGAPHWQRVWTLGLVSAGLILAGAALSRYPWRSVDGYVGHSAGVQALALISVAALTASAVLLPRARGTTPLAEPDGSPIAGPRARGTTPLAEPDE